MIQEGFGPYKNLAVLRQDENTGKATHNGGGG